MGAGDGGGGWNGERWVGGVVTGLARKYTRRGELMATFVLEDLQSSIEVFVFPRTMTEMGYLLADDAVVCVKGRLDLRDDVPKLICSELKRPQLVLDGAEPLARGAGPRRSGRRPGRPAAGAADRAPRSFARVPARGHQGGAPGLGVQCQRQPRAAGRAACTARTCLFVERRRSERLTFKLVAS